MNSAGARAKPPQPEPGRSFEKLPRALIYNPNEN